MERYGVDQENTVTIGYGNNTVEEVVAEGNVTVTLLISIWNIRRKGLEEKRYGEKEYGKKEYGKKE